MRNSNQWSRTAPREQHTAGDARSSALSRARLRLFYFFPVFIVNISIRRLA
jgi:hypothetical protein